MDILFDSIEECRLSIFLYIRLYTLESRFEDSKATVDICVGDHDRWLDTDSLRAVKCATDEDSSFEELRSDLIADLLRGEVLSDEESLSSDRLIDLRVFHDIFLKSLHHIVSLLCRLLREIVSEHHLYTSDRSWARECATARRGRMDEWIRVHHTLPDLLSRDECWYRHDTAAERLPEGHDIWYDSPVIDTEYLPCTSKSRLDLICDEKSTMLSCHLSYSWPVVIWWYDCTGFSLDRLDDDSCDPYSELLTGIELSLHRISISILHEVYFSSIHLSYWITIECLPHHR